MSYFLKAMEIAVLSPSGKSSEEKKSKLGSIEFRPSFEGFFAEEEPDAFSHMGEPLQVSFVIFVGVD